MSFAGTPLGQGRRLDHNAFLNKNTQPHNNRHNTRTFQKPHSPTRSIPTSYAYGAPPTDRDADEPALVRYARAKQEQVNARKLNPEHWSVRDTSVNVAAAFQQAASTSHNMQGPPPPTTNTNSHANSVWASGSQPGRNLPRSTSVEYEKESHQMLNRRLAAPPPKRSTVRRPLSKQGSGHSHISESEDEHGRSSAPNGRGKSPLSTVLDVSKRALDAASFYLRQRSTEPENTSGRSNGRVVGDDSNSSYDYASEERTFQDLLSKQGGDMSQESAKRQAAAAQRRSKMSIDNMAYRPESEEEYSDDDNNSDGEGRKRRRMTKKKDIGTGFLTTLPVAGYGKRRKRKSKGGNENVEEGEEEEERGSEEVVEQQRAGSRPPNSRGSTQPIAKPPSLRGSAPPQQPSYIYDASGEGSMLDVEMALHSIPEVDEPPLADGMSPPPSKPARAPSSFSIGALLGRGVNFVIRFFLGIIGRILRVISAVFMLLGRILGTSMDVIVRRPLVWLSGVNAGPWIDAARYVVISLVFYLAWTTLRAPLTNLVSSGRPPAPFIAPDVPISNLDELSARLQSLESMLAGLSVDYQRSRAQQELDTHGRGELINRIYALEGRLREEATRMAKAEQSAKASASSTMVELRREMESLRAQLHAVESAPRETIVAGPSSDKEARNWLRALEDRVGDVEGGIKEAIELGKNAVAKASESPSPQPGSAAAWWTKLASGTGSKAGGLTIKSSDGQDVSSLMSQLVDNAIARYGTQDILARPDFALHSAGARVIPSLTSSTLELRPQTWRGQVLGLLTGNGYEVGRSPITALHQDTHSGNCWPMMGTEGTLGVALAFPAHLDAFTVDHVAREVAFDLRSAPRDMEVWGLVEGRDNLARYAAWVAEKEARIAEARQRAEDAGEAFSEEEDVAPEDRLEETPGVLRRDVPYVRLASFTYDVHAPQSIQTFAVRDEVRALGIDFGVVSLVVKNNWGRDEFTCIYRFRAHGERLGGIPATFEYEEEGEGSEASS